MCTCVPDRIGIWECWFFRREENRSTQRKKTSPKKERTDNKLNPRMKPGWESNLGAHWWEGSTLTTAPPLLSFNSSLRVLLGNLCLLANIRPLAILRPFDNLLLLANETLGLTEDLGHSVALG